MSSVTLDRLEIDLEPSGPPPPSATGRTLLAPLAAGGLGVLLVLLSLVLPLWQAELRAPQYPQGLHMYAYGGRVTGDVDEINTLNHYVGMRPFRAADIPELALWSPIVVLGASFVVAATVAAVAHRRRLRRAALLGLWAIPLGVLADIQLRLFQYGHDLSPHRALRVEEFTPWVIGPTKVWNFTTLALPGPGLLAVVAAAALVTFGPGLARRVPAVVSWMRRPW